MNDLIDRQTAIQIALEFTVEYLGGAFDEDLQKKLVERMNGVPVVDAISIAWIKEYIRTHPASTDIYFKWMIDEWKEEQKKSYFPKGFFSKERPLAKGEEDETD